MNIWKLSIKNIKSKPLYTFLSVFVLALSVFLLLAVRQLESSLAFQIKNNLGAIDLVIGAKGSPLQLVLSSVLFLDNPTGNIPYAEAKKISKSPFVKTAVPISYGDNYKGYKIVGTTDKFATLYDAKLKEGRNVEKSMEVIVGATVAKQLDLKLGDTFQSSHGLIENGIDVHDEHMIIVGIYKTTNKVIDRLIVSNLESVWDIHHHDSHEINDEHHGHDEHHEHHEKEIEEEALSREVTSVLISFRNPSAFITFPKQINSTTNMQAALPKYELDKLYQYTGIGFKTVSWIAYIILIISCLTIFISLYKMVKERSFELALLRTYGASNFQLIRMVAYEGISIGVFAFLLGYALLRMGIFIMFTFFETDFDQYILQQIPYTELLKIGGGVLVMIIFSVLFAIYPIIKMNISTTLSNEK
ncbi:hypothetical protein SCB49_13030 [unidentified eubacterium SCB49]|nr:hypothetical protein SCB49_13030 [unidentified eubacterium SCB49]